MSHDQCNEYEIIYDLDSLEYDLLMRFRALTEEQKKEALEYAKSIIEKRKNKQK